MTMKLSWMGHPIDLKAGHKVEEDDTVGVAADRGAVESGGLAEERRAKHADAGAARDLSKGEFQASEFRGRNQQRRSVDAESVTRVAKLG
jgi:hypothetical protein